MKPKRRSPINPPLLLLFCTILLHLVSAQVNKDPLFKSVANTYSNGFVTWARQDESFLNFYWRRLYKDYFGMIFLMQMESEEDINYGNEVRLCFESIKVGEDFKREIKGVVFYGDADSGKFTDVGIPNTEYPEDSHEFWLCSRPRNDPYITRLGLRNNQFNVTEPNTINVA